MRSLILIFVVLVAACTGTYEATQLDEADAAAAPADAQPVAADAAGEVLIVSFETSPNGGPFAPKNVVAVWIQGSGNAFEKTIARWAGERAQYLVAWNAASGTDTDAISGATRTSHTGRLTAQWDLTDAAGLPVPDGTYTIRLELADQNATLAEQNHQAIFTFEKNGTASTQSVAGSGFLNVTIEYTGR
jgi:hypothetical protein